MRLPQSLEDRFEIQVEKDEVEGKAMELMSPREKKWLKMGKSEGKTEQAKFCVLEALKIRFGTISETLEVQVSRIEEIEKLRNLHRMAIKAPNLKDFEKSFSEVQIQ